ncbi:MAG TPA: nitroreductase family protein [Candidatus Omnitrophota bacterium]|nr:nitroreductase family protein [Candidatus Omnitrophota bacterium]
MIDLLRKRRSVRAYLNQPIEPEKVSILKEALLRSPSSRDLQPWMFIFVEEENVLTHLSRVKVHGSAFLAGAPMGIVVLGDESASDVWIEGCSVASAVVMLTATSLGLGSCWVQIRNRQHSPSESAENYIRKTLRIPENFRVESIIAIGYPDEEKAGVPLSELRFDKIKTGTFPD